MSATDRRVVVVTGASTGIGEASVAALIDAGFLVLGAVRREPDSARLRERFAGRAFAPLMIDVTDAQGIVRAREATAAWLGQGTLAGLVNNAGVALPGPLLHQPIDEFRRQFEVNLFGQLQVIRAFAPLLHTGDGRQGEPGRIVNMSSVAGSFSAPFLDAYAASKHALEGLSGSLRRELQIYGVDVIAIAPGSVATPIWDKAEDFDVARYDATPFGPSLRRFRDIALTQGREGLPPEAVAKAVVRALTARRPPARIPVVDNYVLDWLLPRLLPARLVDRMIAKRLNLAPVSIPNENSSA